MNQYFLIIIIIIIFELGKKNFSMYQATKENKKFNLFMEVSNKRIYRFTFNTESTNLKNFKLFIEKIINLSQNKIKNSCLII